MPSADLQAATLLQIFGLGARPELLHLAAAERRAVQCRRSQRNMTILGWEATIPTRTAGVATWPSSLLAAVPQGCSQTAARWANRASPQADSGKGGNCGPRRCLGLSRATKDVTTKASEGMPFAIAGLVRPPVLCLGRSNHGLRLASQSCKSCRIALPAWSARRNICQSGSALRDIRCPPYLQYGIRGPQAHRPCK